MKRVKAACLLQTLHFQLKDDIPREEALHIVEEEVKHYKARLEARHIQYRIEDETTQPDGSVIIRLRKQYNMSPMGDYLK